MTRRVPPKRRHHDRPAARVLTPHDEPEDPRGYSAPGHLGGSFDDAGYSAGRGQFGFQHHVTPPLPEWE